MRFVHQSIRDIGDHYCTTINLNALTEKCERRESKVRGRNRLNESIKACIAFFSVQAVVH
jgi:hypothetical protein